MQETPLPQNRIRYFALLTTFLTWLLIMVGGIVHGTGSSLACPDWPTCYGTFFPEMTGGVFFEHSHRLLAASVGFLTVLLCAYLLWKGDKKAKQLSAAAVLMVIFQGVLGGMTVILRLPPAVSTAHLGTSMLYFALLAALTFYLWSPSPDRTLNSGTKARAVLPWAIAAASLVYLQILSGALMRHLGAGLACMDMPLCQGSLWSGQMSTLQKIHMMHRLGSILTATVVTLSSWKIFRGLASAKLRILAALAPFLVLLQIGLGFLSVYLTLNIFSVTAHLGLGALIWLTWVLIVLNLRNDAKTASARESLPLVSPVLHQSPSR